MDPQTWKDLIWPGVTSVLGFVSGLAVITAAGLVVAYVSMPLWYLAVEDPHTEYGLTNVGVFTVDTLGKVAIMTAIAVVLMPLVLVSERFAATHAGPHVTGRRNQPRAS